jgi:hypothetical protein
MTFALTAVTHPERATVARMIAALAEVFGEALTEVRLEGYLPQAGRTQGCCGCRVDGSAQHRRPGGGGHGPACLGALRYMRGRGLGVGGSQGSHGAEVLMLGNES